MKPVDIIKRAYKLLPQNRRILLKGKGYWRLALRKMFYPWFQWPVSVVTDTGIRLIIRPNRIDERMLVGMSGRDKNVYFPPVEVPVESPFFILDIGGHHGFYSMLALGKYPNAKVICVEPSKDAVSIIQEQVSLNNFSNRIEIVEAALGFSNDVAYLKVEQQTWGNRIVNNPSYDLRDVEKVNQITLETVLKSRQPYIVKCNAEGAEFTLIPQLQEMNLHPRLIILMIHPDKCDNDVDISGFVESIRSKGYKAINVRDDPLRPIWHFYLDEAT